MVEIEEGSVTTPADWIDTNDHARLIRPRLKQLKRITCYGGSEFLVTTLDNRVYRIDNETRVFIEAKDGSQRD